jgi:hypothetical protein
VEEIVQALVSFIFYSSSSLDKALSMLGLVRILTSYTTF